jgi:rsbT co-antagonist protein RsbR
MKKENGAVAAALTEEEKSIVEGWVAEVPGTDPAARREMLREATEITRLLRGALQAGADPDMADTAAWSGVTQALDALSRSRAAQGRSAGDTSAFVLALKRPLFAALQRRLSADPTLLVAAVWSISTLADKLAQRTVDTYQKSREEIIKRQQQELLELSTPVIKLWEGVLAVPMIGTLDSNRTQIVMETLLQKIVEHEASLAIIDITGVPTVDTLVAQHLLKTVSAIRLMGADCIISGIRPQIAQTIVHLGIDLQGISSKASLADALSLALQRTGFRITRDGK